MDGQDEPGGDCGALWDPSRSFKDALIGSESCIAEEETRICVKVSYKEASTKIWLDCYLVGRLRHKLVLRSVQQEAKNSSLMLTMSPAEDLYCTISFLDVQSGDKAPRDNIKWFALRSLTSRHRIYLI